MKIVTAGHHYRLWELGGDWQDLFIDSPYQGLKGVLVSDLLQIIGLRTEYLFNILPCHETNDALQWLQYALRSVVQQMHGQISDATAICTVHTVDPGHIYTLTATNKK